MIQPGLLLCIVVLLAKVHTLNMIKESVKQERNVGDWDCLFDLHPPCRVVMCCRFVGVASSMKPRPHTLHRVVAHLPCHPVASVGLT
jgi:hypothetical protein